MKRELQDITDEETEIKNKLDEEGKQKLKYKEHCDKMKHSIKGNREKFQKQEREFEGLIEDNPADGPSASQQNQVVELDVDENAPKEESEIVQSSQAGGDQAVNNKQLKLNPNQQDQIQKEGWRFWFKGKDIMKTFVDEEIAVLARDKATIRGEAQRLRSELE